MYKSFRWTELLLTLSLTFQRLGGVIFYRLNEALDRHPIGDSFQASHKTLTLTIFSFHPEDDVRRKPNFFVQNQYLNSSAFFDPNHLPTNRSVLEGEQRRNITYAR